MKITFKTTKKHFEYFKKRCLYWQKEFGLMHWNFFFFHRDEEGLPYAQWRASDVPKHVEMSFCKSWQYRKFSYQEIDETAMHECLEILILPLTSLLEDRYSYDFINEKRHAVVRVFENFIINKPR